MTPDAKMQTLQYRFLIMSINLYTGSEVKENKRAIKIRYCDANH